MNDKNKKIAFIIIIFAALFLVQEIVFRVIFPLPEVTNFNRVNYSPTFFSGNKGELRYMMNSRFIWASQPDGKEFVNTLNLYGFRDNNWSRTKDPSKARVMFIGDSFVEGFMADDDQTIPAYFADYADGSVEAMNMGIGGNDLFNYFNLIRDALPVFRPDYLVLVLIANDMNLIQFKSKWLDNTITPETSSFLMPRSVSVISNILKGKTVARRWHSKPFYFFMPVPDNSNPWSNDNNANEYSAYVRSDIASAMKAGKFNPFMVNEYDVYKQNLSQYINITKHFNAISEYAQTYVKKLIIVYIPSRNQVSDYYLPYQKDYNKTKELSSLQGPEYQIHAKHLAETCTHLGIPFLDMTPLVSKSEKEGNRLYWNYDEHMKAVGYKFVAKSIYDFYSKHQ